MDKVMNHPWFVPVTIIIGSVEWPLLIWYTMLR